MTFNWKKVFVLTNLSTT